jgi:hypothetical protein
MGAAAATAPDILVILCRAGRGLLGLPELVSDWVLEMRDLRSAGFLVMGL